MNDIPTALRSLARQEQFLDVVDRDEATARFHRHLRAAPARRRDGAAVAGAGPRSGARRSSPMSTFPVSTDPASTGSRCAPTIRWAPANAQPKALALNAEILTPGTVPRAHGCTPGTATLIATGGMVPRGADAVVMVEHTETREDDGGTAIEVRRAAAAGQFIAFAGSDLARGETVLRAGQVLTSREIGMLAAVGCAAVEVWRRPRVAIISTGDEIVAPGKPIRPGAVYDSNAAILAAAVEEAGGMPKPLGIGPDDEIVLSRLVDEGLGGLRHGDPVRRHLEGRRRSVLPRHCARSMTRASSCTASR